MIVTHPLAPFRNTFGIEAAARLAIDYNGTDDLRRLFQEGEMPAPESTLHRGSASNLVPLSPVVDATVMHNSDYRAYVLWDDDLSVGIRVAAGHVWDSLVEYSLHEGWYGLENLSGIPGEVGSAAVQNIGAYGVEVCQRISAIEVFDMLTGRTDVIPVERAGYGYRMSMFKRPENRHLIVTHVRMSLDKLPVLNLSYKPLARALEGIADPGPDDVRRAVIALRDSKLPNPAEHGNAGSFFKNPVVSREDALRVREMIPDLDLFPAAGDMVKLSAARLIDAAGWKGRVQGNVGVWHRQPLVLYNAGGATGADVKAMAEAIIADIKKLYGIVLHPEVQFV